MHVFDNKTQSSQPELAAPTPAGTSTLTAIPLPNAVGTFRLLISSKTTWMGNVKSGGEHVCVISSIL